MDTAFAWLPEDLRSRILADLAAPMPRGRGDLAYRARPEGLDRAEIDGKAHVVFLAYYPYPNSLKKSIALRQSGRYTTTLLACCIREDLNKRAPRRMGVLRPLKLVIDNYPDNLVEEMDAVNNPEDPAAGTRMVPFSRELYIDRKSVV